MKWICCIEMWLRFVHFKLFKKQPNLNWPNYITMNASNYDGGGPIASRFDSDSVKIGIDNHATRSLSPNMHHFEDL